MSSFQIHAPITLLITLLIIIPNRSSLDTDGMLLISFKYSILTDPFSALQSWNYNDANPCSWNGVTCGTPGAQNPTYNRVTGLSLPNSQLLGSIPSELALVKHLQIVDLSNNSLNGSLPLTFSNATELRFLDLSNNLISGEIPDIFGCYNLRFLNLSDNALAGSLPANLTSLQNLTVVSLKNNYLFGNIPSGFNSVEVLDLSSNLFNGSLPSQFGGYNLRYFNVSYNRLSGPIPYEFAANIPRNATVDLSYNNLTGQVPKSVVFLNQKASDFAGNPDLCGNPTQNPCPIPSQVSSVPNVSSSPMSSPAIAAIPRTIDSSPVNAPPGSGLRRGTVIGIIIGDVAGVFILGLLFFYVYYLKKKKKKFESKPKNAAPPVLIGENWSSSSTSSESRVFTRWSCLRQKKDSEEDSGASASSDEESTAKGEGGRLVTVDGEKELELETLLKASAYILGATGSSIMYKAVLEDGTALAVRRIGESQVERFRDFENQVRVISKLVHPNLVRIHGFYWGLDEKLLIYDFVPNGSLANSRFRKASSSPCHLPWEARLRIAKGVARGLSFLHEKRHVHGNLKPSNILLGPDMEPRIGDFGLEKFVIGDSSSYKAGGSARNFGSKRSSASRDSFQDYPLGPSPSPSPSSIGGLSPYHAPESLRSLKPNPKWDVFSFGVILLELLTGKVIAVDEMGQGNNGLTVEDKNRALRMADVAIRTDVEGKEEALLACFKLGYSCASPLPQKRPSMKEALQVLDKIPSSTPTYFYGY